MEIRSYEKGYHSLKEGDVLVFFEKNGTKRIPMEIISLSVFETLEEAKEAYPGESWGEEPCLLEKDAPGYGVVAFGLTPISLEEIKRRKEAMP